MNFFKWFFFFINFSGLLFGQHKYYEINHLNKTNVNSGNIINSIIKDSKGFMWFATEEGLIKYDGYTFYKFKIPTHVEINKILHTKNQLIWCATKRGLFCFDAITETFLDIDKNILELHKISFTDLESTGNSLWLTSRRGLFHLENIHRKAIIHNELKLKNYDGSNSKIPQNFLTQIHIDQQGILWIGTSGNYIFSFDPKKKQFKTVPVPYDHKAKKDNNNIIVQSIFEQDNILWIGGRDQGVIKFNKKTEKSEVKINYNANSGSIQTQDVFVDNENTIWAATWDGIDRIEQVNGKYIWDDKNWNHHLFKKRAQNRVLCFYYDKSGILWVGTEGSGIIKITFKNQEHQFISFHSPFNTHSFSTDDKNHLWLFSTYNGIKKSVKKLDKELPSFVNFTNKMKKQGMNSSVILCQTQDKHGNFWFGTDKAGAIYKIKDGKIIPVNLNLKSLKTKNTKIRALCFDHNNNLWIGTSNGIVFYDFKNKKELTAKRTINQTHSINSNYILDIKEDSKHNIWIATLNGLNKLIEIKEEKLHFQSFEDYKNPVKKKGRFTVKNIFESKDGTIWLGYNDGLRFIENGQPKKIAQNNELPNEKINCIIEDNNNNLWIGTNSGITFYNKKSQKLKTYHQGTHVESAFKDTYGKLFFGHKTGIITFDPQQLKTKHDIPPIGIVNLKIDNKDVHINQPVNGQIIIDKNINFVDKLELNHPNHNFSLDIVGLAYRFQNLNLYKYKLEGVDKDWISVDAKSRLVAYKNLSPGTYTLKIKAANYEKLWTAKEKELTIIIHPAWWNSWWAKTFYVFVIASLILFIFFFRIKQLRKEEHQKAARQKMEHDIEIANIKVEKEKELSDLKINFFTNISHEIRTPLTLIISPLKELIATPELPKKVQKQLATMQLNGDRLLKIINQLLDFKKIENEQLPLQIENVDMNNFIKNIVKTFKNEATKRKINFKLLSEITDNRIWFDPKLMETAVVNLLSNAFKFTSEAGEIIVEVSSVIKDSATYCKISVSDTGIGISKENQPRLFDRFYQVKNQAEKGTGIGLSLVKEIINLHKGEVNIKSEIHQGSTFELIIPTQQEQYTTENNKIETTEIPPTEQVITTKTKNKETLLIVEDTQDLLTYLCSLFEEDYTILTAENGEQALEILENQLPDLIISDVMMPVMDGIEFCKAVKSSEKTSYIPVILLTAKTSDLSKIEGLETGADDYMTKPFNSSVLSLKVQNFISNRKQTRAFFKSKVLLEPNTEEIHPKETELIIKTIAVIEEHLTNPEFNAEFLASQLFMSKATLYRKIKAQTDLSINHFIRSVKMKKAAELLLTKQYPVNEISFMVGYADVGRFRKYFVEHFGMPPTKYVKEKLK